MLDVMERAFLLEVWQLADENLNAARTSIDLAGGKSHRSDLQSHRNDMKDPGIFHLIGLLVPPIGPVALADALVSAVVNHEQSVK